MSRPLSFRLFGYPSWLSFSGVSSNPIFVIAGVDKLLQTDLPMVLAQAQVGLQAGFQAVIQMIRAVLLPHTPKILLQMRMKGGDQDFGLGLP